ncbi:Hypothetical predicted protein [Cloeon dipterum]|uniref:Uncharacterized protein n=1 Tax=Cloeon dipterum TaxID=197152 RepID=A0A8S1C670_9INSE|nr:Hypothetical predicted protein [Cloeon dipterum]
MGELQNSIFVLFSLTFLWLQLDSARIKNSINVAKDRNTGPIAEWMNTTKDVLNYADPEFAADKLQCSRQKFNDLFDCCKKDREIFFSNASIARCNKGGLRGYDSFLVNYNLNWYQSRDTNAINLKSSFIRSTLGPAMCFVECIFRQEKLIFRSKTVNYDKLMTKLTKEVKSVATRRMESIINDCRLNVEDLPLVTIKTPVKKCLIRPLMLVQCLRKQFLFECPRNKTVHSTSCNQSKLNLRYCEIV